MKQKIALTLIAVLALGVSQSVWAGDLEKRVKALEEIQEATLQQQQQQQPVTPYTAQKIQFGGFSTANFRSNFGKSTSKEYTFEEVDLDLLIGADVTEKLRLFADVHFAFHSHFENPNAAWRTFERWETEIEPEIVTMEYRF